MCCLNTAVVLAFRFVRSGAPTCTAINIPPSPDRPAVGTFLKEKAVKGGALPGFYPLQEKHFRAI